MSPHDRAWLLTCSLALGACRPAAAEITAHLDARLAAVEQANAGGDAKLRELEVRAEHIQRATRELLQVWDQVEADMGEAARHLEAAARRQGEATEAYRQAQRDYEQAARNWKIVAVSLMVASLSSSGSSSLCGGQMNTAKVRRVWRKKGYDLDGIDADHIWPKSLGGANHPWNYQRMAASLNRSLGNKLGWKLLNEPVALLRGGAVSAAIALACR
ncbi:hypothetical protein ENSA5_47810 [Enhygromyxa salina]|uniref:Uncharacterized protein n=1 Tax=Enhygromyxa salina TaxID=215803 RepID=A0A2S9XIP4_9BACT|nr:hypothetical protein [Enhygromyxa salina]PRP92600.1 hypothetical protein ENSA5_47810 [Enhygromyxa salina]